MIKILIITHGELGVEILKTAESIVGKQDNVEVISLHQNEGLESLCERVRVKIMEIPETEGVLLLSDMLGGTPCNACLPFCNMSNVEIASGINLYMLLSAFINRNNAIVSELVKKVLSDGRKNIENAKEMFLKQLR